MMDSDHHGITIDLSCELFSPTKNNGHPNPLRWLKTTNNNTLDKYIQYVEHQFQSFRILQRIEQLENNIKEQGPTNYQQYQFQSIDENITAILKMAEKNAVNAPLQFHGLQNY